MTMTTPPTPDATEARRRAAALLDWIAQDRASPEMGCEHEAMLCECVEIKLATALAEAAEAERDRLRSALTEATELFDSMADVWARPPFVTDGKSEQGLALSCRRRAADLRAALAPPEGGRDGAK